MYHELTQALLTEGRTVEVRGSVTKELLGMQLVIDPRFPLADRPRFNEKFALIETLQAISGRGDLAQLRKLAPGFPKLAPTYVTYGPRMAWQLLAIYDRMKQDPDSRQALVAIYEPQDFWKGYPDLPCTLSLQFLVRDGDLHLICTMRSNDVWFGTPNDVYMFTFLQREMAAALNCGIGSYVHQVGSLHAYSQHFAPLHDVGAEPQPERASLPPGLTWSNVRETAGFALDEELGDASNGGGNQRIWWNWLSQ